MISHGHRKAEKRAIDPQYRSEAASVLPGSISLPLPGMRMRVKSEGAGKPL